MLVLGSLAFVFLFQRSFGCSPLTQLGPGTQVYDFMKTTSPPPVPSKSDYYDDIDMHLTQINVVEPPKIGVSEKATSPLPHLASNPPFSPIKPSQTVVVNESHNPKTVSTLSLPSTSTSPPAPHKPVISVHLPNDPVPQLPPLLPPAPSAGHHSQPLTHRNPPKSSRSVVLGAPPKLFSPTLKPFLIPVFRSRDLPSIFLRDVALPTEKPKGLPSFFDLFRPLPTPPPFKNPFIQHLPPFSDVPRLSSPIVTNPLFILRASPPIPWTFCDPICGSGDQAVDAESALENAQQDIREGIEYAFKQSHLAVPTEDQVNIKYHPNSTILEEFGKYYGWDGYQYVTLGNSVAYRRHKDDSTKNGQFFVEVRVNIQQHGRISTSTWRQIAKNIQYYIKMNKGARFQEDIRVEHKDDKPN